MKKHLLIFGTLLALAPTSAHARYDWWLVFGYGEKPGRALVYVNQKAIGEWEGLPNEAPYWRVEGSRVFEAADADDYEMFTYDIRCGRTPEEATYRTYFRATMARDYSLQSFPSNVARTPFVSVRNDLVPMRVAEFVCQPAVRNPDNGMFQVTGETRPTDATWAIFWKDGNRPPYIQTKTKEELDADFNRLVTQVESRRAVTESMGDELRAMDAEDRDGRQRVERRRKEAKRHLSWSPDARVHRTLETWMSRREQDLISAWGSPHRSHETNGIRFLTYEFGHDMVSYQSGAFGTGETGRSQYRCNVQFESKRGELIDFRVSGNYCAETIK